MTRVAPDDGAFDEIFAAIANDEYRALFVDTTAAVTLAPYDGGFDILAADPEVTVLLEAGFVTWMSDREDRL